MESNVKSLCGSEVTRKIKQLEVEGARAPVPHSWRRQWPIGLHASLFTFLSVAKPDFCFGWGTTPSLFPLPLPIPFIPFLTVTLPLFVPGFKPLNAAKQSRGESPHQARAAKTY